MLIKLDDAIAAVEAEMDKCNQYIAAGLGGEVGIDKNTARYQTARSILAALRALPTVSDGWEDIARKGPTDEAMDSAFKAYNYKYFGDYELSEDQWDAVHTMVSAMEAFKSLRAALGPLPAPPSECIE